MLVSKQPLMAPPSCDSLQSSTCVVCLVDDDADYRLLVDIIFRRNMPSYSLRLFDSGLTFLDALPELSADLIILDQHMPGLSGLQTLRAVKQQPHYRSLPVVMMSAAASHPEITSFYQAGAIRNLAKQADVTRLKDSLLLACQLASKLG